MQKWEYKEEIIYRDAHLETLLNALGDFGWELMQVLPYNDMGQQQFIFKRPVPVEEK